MVMPMLVVMVVLMAMFTVLTAAVAMSTVIVSFHRPHLNFKGWSGTPLGLFVLRGRNKTLRTSPTGT
jgi:hypothetical protein